MPFFEVAVLVLGSVLIWRVKIMADNLSRLRASVIAQTSVIASAVALLGGLSEQVRANADDPDALNALADQIDSQTASLAQAVAIDTPASNEVHADQGGTGDDDTHVDPETVELVEAAPASGEETGGGEGGTGSGGGEAQE